MEDFQNNNASRRKIRHKDDSEIANAQAKLIGTTLEFFDIACRQGVDRLLQPFAVGLGNSLD